MIKELEQELVIAERMLSNTVTDSAVKELKAIIADIKAEIAAL